MSPTVPTADLLSGQLPALPAGWRGADQLLVLWDGDCGFCRRCIDWARRHDSHQVFYAVPYQKVPEPTLGEPLRSDCARAVQVVRPDGTLLRAGRAVIYLLEQIGWRLARPLRWPPLVWATELGYRTVASHRRFFSRFF